MLDAQSTNQIIYHSNQLRNAIANVLRWQRLTQGEMYDTAQVWVKISDAIRAILVEVSSNTDSETGITIPSSVIGIRVKGHGDTGHILKLFQFSI